MTGIAPGWLAARTVHVPAGCRAKIIIAVDVCRSAAKAVAFVNGLYYRLTFPPPPLVSPAFRINEVTAQRAELDTVEVAGRRYFTDAMARLKGGASMSVGLSHDSANGPTTWLWSPRR